MGQMFFGSKFDQDISRWDVSKVMYMQEMFFGTGFNQDISGWDVSKVANMAGMFEEARYFNQDISRWDVGKVTDMTRMFYNATRFNQNLCPWNNVIPYISNGLMFAGSGCNYNATPISSIMGPYCSVLVCSTTATMKPTTFISSMPPTTASPSTTSPTTTSPTTKNPTMTTSP
ncbi:hypothetical protein ACHAXH_000403, partial [Discostella pseudostelligera]